ncbi:VIT and vWA domain-containing protein [Microbulbifer guangxiensis]|uniref:VIT and vWA domain-containing protein n=1 Tax=Microbulbifer guangxiensis TaxID=2904249 RepID=UPI001F33B182|nr:VIT and VWA domain-containing protein [Microbulbifer guangxiensis]
MNQWPNIDGHAQGLVARDGKPVPLQAVEVAVDIQGLLAEVVIAQDYANREVADIEVSYTFPVPAEAVLMGVEARIGDREISGMVAESTEAESRYEDAIADGDSAILLQQLRAGLYSLSLGNLQSGENARITYRYALALRWNDDRVDLRLPTTIAPKYGDPNALGMQPHQTLDADSTYRCQFQLSIVVAGLLADAAVTSPTHDITTRMEAAGLQIGLQDGAADMDRDLVVTFRQHSDRRCAATVARDGDGYVAMLNYRPSIPIEKTAISRNLAIVVDCSGSMGGDSIRQAGIALSNIGKALHPEDHINIILFGSHYELLFPGQVAVDAKVKNRIRRLGRSLQADLGGTELASALQAAYESLADIGPGDVLLITDGEVYAEDAIVEPARDIPHRVFCVGVGSAVSEGVLRSLSTVTGGSAEFVTPNEDMPERITRHFERIRSGRANEITVHWPQSPLESLPLTQPLYDGDTVSLYYWFDQQPQGTVRVALEGKGGTIEEVEAAIGTKVDVAVTNVPATLARFAAARKLDTIDRREHGLPIALDYQLLTPWTSVVAVDSRAAADKAGSVPVLREVPQMRAAGWGGLSTVRSSIAPALEMFCVREYQSMEISGRHKRIAPSGVDRSLFSRSYSRSQDQGRFQIDPANLPIDDLIERLAAEPSEQGVIEILQDFGEALRLGHGLRLEMLLLFSQAKGQLSEEQLFATILIRLIQARPKTVESITAVERLRALQDNSPILLSSEKLDQVMAGFGL